MEPSEIASASMLNRLSAKVAAPSEGATRPSGRVIDYFAISNHSGAAEAKVLYGWDLAPRFPVELRSRADSIAKRMQIMSRPRKLPRPIPRACCG